MNYWLFKSEPSTFSIDDLDSLPQKTDSWDGIRNYMVRNMMRDQMKKNDLAFFYHSSCKVPGIIGIIKIVKESYPDHTAHDHTSKYFDPKSNIENPRWCMVDVKLIKKFKTIIPLSALRQEEYLANMTLLKKGNRLSITNVTSHDWEHILLMANN